MVVANEYADLYSDSPMKAGRTELDVDGESYTLAYTTTLEDIGEARDAYVTGETVLYIADAGNTVFETGAEADIATASKFENVTGLERTTLPSSSSTSTAATPTRPPTGSRIGLM